MTSFPVGELLAGDGLIIKVDVVTRALISREPKFFGRPTSVPDKGVKIGRSTSKSSLTDSPTMRRKADKLLT